MASTDRRAFEFAAVFNASVLVLLCFVKFKCIESYVCVITVCESLCKAFVVNNKSEHVRVSELSAQMLSEPH